ncbi:MAG TPA: ATP-binding protein [Solirubrobacteraceae bacterium]|nr:ATP-binding protein [Solirubrobacteraceae bacterium]
MALSRSRNLAAALGALLLAYLSWQLFHWLPGRQQLGQLFLPLFDVIAVLAAWGASRRCAPVPGLRRFWKLICAAILAELIADVILSGYDMAYDRPPFPTPADAFFLAFFALLLVSLLFVPVARMTRAARVRMLLDGATIVLGGGAVVWYLVLGPTVLSTGEDLLAKSVSMAYPICDLVLLGAVAVVLLRRSPAALRLPLLWIAAAMLLTVAADTAYGYGVLHDTYTAGDPVDTLYVLGYCALALAALTQRPAGEHDPSARVQESARRYRVAPWLPYVGLTVGFGVLLGVSLGHAFFPELSLVGIVIVLAALVAARQWLAQRELGSVQAELRKSERAKEEFVAVVGHELRTPLTSIRGSLGLLAGGLLGELPKDAANMLALAVLNTDRLIRLVNDILDIERMDSGHLPLERAAVGAQELVRSSAQALDATAVQAGVRLRTDVEELTVCADADRVVQALVNLLGNAIKFSPSDGFVTVAVSRGDGCALFSVKDSGRGIPADQLDSIFERFKQVDVSDAREKGGSGLGLAIARGIVESHGGHLWAESIPGQGSTFCFTLPLAGEDASCSAGAPIERARSAKKREEVLL